jgi:hypothetical protein
MQLHDFFAIIFVYYCVFVGLGPQTMPWLIKMMLCWPEAETWVSENWFMMSHHREAFVVSFKQLFSCLFGACHFTREETPTLVVTSNGTEMIHWQQSTAQWYTGQHDQGLSWLSRPEGQEGGNTSWRCWEEGDSARAVRGGVTVSQLCQAAPMLSRAVISSPVFLPAKTIKRSGVHCQVRSGGKLVPQGPIWSPPSHASFPSLFSKRPELTTVIDPLVWSLCFWPPRLGFTNLDAKLPLPSQGSSNSNLIILSSIVFSIRLSHWWTPQHLRDLTTNSNLFWI